MKIDGGKDGGKDGGFVRTDTVPGISSIVSIDSSQDRSARHITPTH